MSSVLQVIAIVLNFAGMILLNERKRVGWLVLASSAVFYVWLFGRAELYLLILSQVMFTIINVRGWTRWKDASL